MTQFLLKNLLNNIASKIINEDNYFYLLDTKGSQEQVGVIHCTFFWAKHIEHNNYLYYTSLKIVPIFKDRRILCKLH